MRLRRSSMLIMKEQQCQGSQLRDFDRSFFFTRLREACLVERSFIVAASLLDSRIASASFAFDRCLISRSSPVSAISKNRSFGVLLFRCATLARGRLCPFANRNLHPWRWWDGPRWLPIHNVYLRPTTTASVVSLPLPFGGQNESNSHPPVW